jgi:hypothetical protein
MASPSTLIAYPLYLQGPEPPNSGWGSIKSGECGQRPVMGECSPGVIIT